MIFKNVHDKSRAFSRIFNEGNPGLFLEKYVGRRFSAYEGKHLSYV